MKLLTCRRAILILVIAFLVASKSKSEEWFHPGPEGGNIFSVTISPHDPDVIYLGSMGRGVYKSTDRCESWGNFTEGIPAWSDTSLGLMSAELPCWWNGDVPPMYFIRCHPAEEDILYGNLGGSERIDGFPLLLSEDGGTTWSEMSDGLPEDIFITDFWIHPAEPDTMLLSVANNEVGPLFRSNDGGESWFLLEGFPAESYAYVHDIEGDPNVLNHVLISYDNENWTVGLVESWDSGDTWEVIYDDIGFSSLKIHSLNNFIVMGLVESWNLTTSLYISYTGGDSWSLIEGPWVENEENITWCDSDSSGLIYALSDGYSWFHGSNLYVSSDIGTSWTWRSDFIKSFTMDIFKGDEILLASGTLKGPYISDNDGFSFEQKPTGINAARIKNVITKGNDPNGLIVNAFIEEYHSSPDENNNEWRLLNPTSEEYIDWLKSNPENPDTLYKTISSSDSLFWSHDGGNTWEPLIGTGYLPFINMWFDPQNPSIIYSSEGNYFRKRSEYGTVVDYEYEFDDPFSICAIDPTEPNRVYVVNGNPRHIWISDDGGQTFSLGGLVLYDPDNFTINPQNGNIYYSWTYNLYMSDDYGLSFTEILTDDFCTRHADIEFNPIFPNPLYVGTDNGIWKSYNEGETWTHLEGPYDRRVTCLDFSPDGRVLHIGTNSDAVWTLYDESVYVRHSFDSQELPSTLELLSAYPNPSNSSISIPFDLPGESEIQLSIYNVLGQKVTTILDRKLTAGSHTAVWNGVDLNGTGVSSGIYFVRMEAEDVVSTQKIVMLK